MDRKLNERQVMLIVETALAVVAFALSVWGVYAQFGAEISNNPIFNIIIFYFGILGFILLRMRWSEAKKKSIDEKVDELINEIRQDRNDRNKKHRN